MKIRYHSFDFDGSLSNEIYAQQLEDLAKKKSDGRQEWSEVATTEEVDQAIIEANKDFLNGIKSTRGEADDYVIVGSNRQDLYIDWQNGTAKGTPGSVFPRIKAISEFLGAKLDKFLLADLVSGKKSGSEFDNLSSNTNLINQNGSYKNFNYATIESYPNTAKNVDDKSKVAILFAQMQKASMEHPDDVIEFNFYDDRKDIIEGLKDFFEKNPELIPKNVVLNLSGYSGPKPDQAKNDSRSPSDYPYGPPQSIALIQGKGRIPKVEQEWVQFYKDMTNLLISEKRDSGEEYISSIDVAAGFNSQKLLDKYTKEGIPFEQIPKLAQDLILKQQVELLIQGQELPENKDHIKHFFKLAPEIQEAIQIRLLEINSETSKSIIDAIKRERDFRYVLDKMDKIQENPTSLQTKHEQGLIKVLQDSPDWLDVIRHRYKHPNEKIEGILDSVTANTFVAKYDLIKDKKDNQEELHQLAIDYSNLTDGEKNKVKNLIQAPEYIPLRQEIHDTDNALACIKKLDAWTNNPELLNQNRDKSQKAGMVKLLSDHPREESIIREHYNDKMKSAVVEDLFKSVDAAKTPTVTPVESFQTAKARTQLDRGNALIGQHRPPEVDMEDRYVPSKN